MKQTLKQLLIIFGIISVLILSGCTLKDVGPKACTMEAKICPDGSSVGRTGPNCEFSACPQTQIANPASKYCIDNGGTLDIRTANDGSQSGYCTLTNGTICEEWAYMRGECGNTTDK